LIRVSQMHGARTALRALCLEIGQAVACFLLSQFGGDVRRKQY